MLRIAFSSAPRNKSTQFLFPFCNHLPHDGPLCRSLLPRAPFKKNSKRNFGGLRPLPIQNSLSHASLSTHGGREMAVRKFGLRKKLKSLRKYAKIKCTRTRACGGFYLLERWARRNLFCPPQSHFRTFTGGRRERENAMAPMGSIFSIFTHEEQVLSPENAIKALSAPSISILTISRDFHAKMLPIKLGAA